jgi:hypothetical protein
MRLPCGWYSFPLLLPHPLQVGEFFPEIRIVYVLVVEAGLIEPLGPFVVGPFGQTLGEFLGIEVGEGGDLPDFAGGDEFLLVVGELVVEQGFDPQYGARPLKRTLQRELVNELAKHVLAGNYVKGDTVLIDADAAGLLFGRKTVVDGKEVVTKKLEVRENTICSCRVEGATFVVSSLHEFRLRVVEAEPS